MPCSTSCQLPWSQCHIVKPPVRELREAEGNRLCQAPVRGFKRCDVLPNILKGLEPLAACRWSAHTQFPANLGVEGGTYSPIREQKNSLGDANARRGSRCRQPRKDRPQRGEGFFLLPGSVGHRQDRKSTRLNSSHQIT